MQFTKVAVSLLFIASVVVLNVHTTDVKTRVDRIKQRAEIKKDKLVNNIKEKKLDAQEKADEIEEKAGEYLAKKKEQAKKKKREISKKARKNWNKGLEKAKVREE